MLYAKKTNRNSRYSAGILPYTFDQTGKCLFLLGKDYDNDWSDFGGRCEFRDNNEPLNTACREFYEETLGSIMTIKECMDKIDCK
jgi:8-oxo-dGTP pyrophosphatase MutT (NUDIX family)